MYGCGLQVKGQPDKRGHAVPTPRGTIFDPEKQHLHPGWLPTFIYSVTVSDGGEVLPPWV